MTAPLSGLAREVAVVVVLGLVYVAGGALLDRLLPVEEDEPAAPADG